MASWKENLSFILVGPTEPGNIGAAARAIKNMGFRKLELVAIAFPSLNLAQSVMIVAYELSRVSAKANPLPLVENREVQRLFQRIPKTLKDLGYGQAGDRDLPAEITRHLKRLIARSGLTDWQLNMLLGLCTQVERKLGAKLVERLSRRPARS